MALNGEDAPTEALLADRRSVRSLRIAATTKGRARDLAMAEARGEILYFLDDDVLPPPGFPQKVAAAFAAHPEAGVIGGPNLTPPGGSALERAQGILLASKLGAAGMSRRYRDGLPGPADEGSLILCNLGIRKQALAGLAFGDGLACGEENLLLWRLARRGVPMRFEPALALEHRRRATLEGFLGQVFRSGLGRMQVAWREPGSLKMIHVLPSAGFLMALCFPGILPCYAVLALVFAAVHAEPWLALLMPAAHTAYALGFLVGVFRRGEKA